MPLPLLTRAAPSRPSLATRTAAITRPRGGSTASQLLRRSSLRRSQRPPLTAPHLEHLECGMQFRFLRGRKNLQTTHLPKKRTAAITRPRGGSTAFAAHLRRSSLASQLTAGSPRPLSLRRRRCALAASQCWRGCTRVLLSRALSIPVSLPSGACTLCMCCSSVCGRNACRRIATAWIMISSRLLVKLLVT